MRGRCKLCLKDSELENSHFIPKFIGKWLKKTSITGYFRESENTQKRKQDIPKQYLLCGDCEDLFSRWETKFANQIFYPYVKDPSIVKSYGPWLAKFAASVSWRTLIYMMSVRNLGEKDENFICDLQSAEHGLRKFLLGDEANLYKFEQHLYPVDKIESTNHFDLPTNINRYLLRTIAMDITQSPNEIFIYTKLPKFILLGVVKSDCTKKMRSSRLSISNGRFGPRTYNFPDGFGNYLIESAKEIWNRYDDIPEDQRKKIEQYAMDHPDKVLNSDLFEAIMDDYKMFGRDALN